MVAGTYLAALLMVGLLLLPDFGVGWDEVTRWRSGDLKLAYYESLLTEGGRNFGKAGVDRYPGLFDLSLASIRRIIPVDRVLLGHFWSFLFGYIGLLALWRTGARLAGEACGAAAVVLLSLHPQFFGHWFHNPKDIPFAAMYLVGIYGCVRFLALPDNQRWRSCWVPALAIGLAMAVRLPGIVLLPILALVLLLQALVEETGSGRSRREASMRLARRALQIGILCATILIIALLFTSLWWPASHRNPFAEASTTLGQLHSSAAEIPVLFRGRLFPASETPFYYSVWMLLVSTPEPFILLILAAFVQILWRLRTHGVGTCPGKSNPETWILVFVLLAGVGPLAYVTAVAPALHNGFRHMLYVLGPLSILGGVAWANGLKRAPRRSLQLAWIGVGGVLMASQLLTLRQLHPYQYVHFNSLAGGLSGAFGQYELEYWFTANTHALQQLPRLAASLGLSPSPEAPIGVFLAGPRESAMLSCPAGFFLAHSSSEATFFISGTTMMTHLLLPGEVVFQIERQGVPLLVVTVLLPP